MWEEGFQDSAGQTRSLKHFDNWAATFGEQVTAVELKPEGTGFRLRTRFSRFYNLPELMNRWKEMADIQTADMLNLPVPEAVYVTIQTEPSEAQKAMVQFLAERVEKIRREKLDPRIDNMLKITSDGRKLALNQRIMNPLLPDDPGSKVNACVDKVFQIWQEYAETKGAQLIFSDLSTPKGKAEPKRGEAKEYLTHLAELSDDVVGNITRINNVLEKIPQSLEAHRENLVRLQREMENAKEEMEKPFPQEQELAEKSARLAELNTILDKEEKDGGKDADEEREEKQETWADLGTRPSILKALKEYGPPAPANAGVGRRMEREAVG